MANEGQDAMLSKGLDEFIKWVARQETNTVLLVLIIVSNGVVGYYGIKEIKSAVPAHLNQIQRGYEKIEAAHERETQRLIELLSDIEKQGQFEFKPASHTQKKPKE